MHDGGGQRLPGHNRRWMTGIKSSKVQSIEALQADSKSIQSRSIGSGKKKKEDVSAVVPYYQTNPSHGSTSYSPNNHSPPSKMDIKEMIKYGYRPGTWLGAKSDGIIELIEHNGQKGRAGIGYQRTCFSRHVAENPVDGDYEPLTTYFLDEEVLFVREDIAELYPRWRMFFDGAGNFKGVGIGAVLISESGQHYPASTKIRFSCTNNMAEYEACIFGIRMAVDLNIKELLVIGDSNLLIHQVQGEWSTKNVKILSYLHCHLDKNYINPIKIEIKDQHAYCVHVNEEPDSKPWYHDIKKFLVTHEYLENASNGQKLALGRTIEPAASNGHRFILVAIDYLTKWVEASTYKVVTKHVVADFVWNNIVCRFGIPESIITNNAANLNSDLMREICEKFRIVHHNSIPYRPQMNGAVEAANKNIKRILRNIVDNHRQWLRKLPFAILGYQTIMRASIGATWYILVYGTESVIPAKVEIPS
ncbi:uncharacterized protein LOC142168196 [Nicotiana tabacum]|uniref:Uncharacterized protein LOC142168196 n=1 Tax=Nicotiana tabacum TaxID=4097 RepID=A0AC58SJ29_TOBAC